MVKALRSKDRVHQQVFSTPFGCPSPVSSSQKVRTKNLSLLLLYGCIYTHTHIIRCMYISKRHPSSSVFSPHLHEQRIQPILGPRWITLPQQLNFSFILLLFFGMDRQREKYNDGLYSLHLQVDTIIANRRFLTTEKSRALCSVTKQKITGWSIKRNTTTASCDRWTRMDGGTIWITNLALNVRWITTAAGIDPGGYKRNKK